MARTKEEIKEYNKQYYINNKARAQLLDKQNRLANKEARAKTKKQWQWDNKDHVRLYNKHIRLRNYGITLEIYEEMVLEQNNCCAICRCELVGKNNASSAPVVDHCHESLEVRGILCMSCNKGLGMFKDDITALQNAIEYLKIFSQTP